MRNTKQQARNPHTRSSVRWLAIPLAAAMAVAACGQADDEVTSGIVADDAGDDANTDADPNAGTDTDPDADAGAEGDDEAADQDDGDAEDDAGEDDGMNDAADATDGDNDAIRTESFDEVLSAQPAEIDEIVALDDTTLGVRFVNAAEPCARARVTVVERAASVEVALETGLHPNAAAMSCIAAVMTYEIPVELAEPIGDREIVAVAPDAGDGGSDDAGGDDGSGDDGTGDDESADPGDGDDTSDDSGGDDVSGELSGYVGLSEADAEAKARNEGREYRVERRDGEDFALTMDFNPTRVNVVIESGSIVAARTG